MKLYNPENPDLITSKPWFIKIQQDGNEVDVCAVDNKGNHLVFLASFTDRGLNRWVNAKQALKVKGFDTTLCEWDDFDRIKDITP